MDKLKNDVVEDSRLEYTEKSDVVPEVAINETAPQSDKEVSSSESGGTINGISGKHTTESTEVKKDELAATLAMENKTEQRTKKRKKM